VARSGKELFSHTFGPYFAEGGGGEDSEGSENDEEFHYIIWKM
jgi:hypothetical protein